MGFPGSSACKESACNVGDPCLSPGLGRSAGEGLGYPLQYSWVSLVAQMVKKICSQCRRHRVQSLGLEDPLEKGMAIHSSIPTWRFHDLQTAGHDWVTFTSLHSDRTSRFTIQFLYMHDIHVIKLREHHHHLVHGNRASWSAVVHSLLGLLLGFYLPCCWFGPDSV